MQRTFTIALNSHYTQALIEKLRPLEAVVGLALQSGGSIKPPGDVLTLHVLNTGADAFGYPVHCLLQRVA